jgi:hypothetical protein
LAFNPPAEFSEQLSLSSRAKSRGRLVDREPPRPFTRFAEI